MDRIEFTARKDALRKRYPYQFKQLPYYKYSIQPGWILVLERLCQAIDSVLTDEQKPVFYWLQIKEKFGGLRAYWSRGRIHIDIFPIVQGQSLTTLRRNRDDGSSTAIEDLDTKVEPLIQAAREAAVALCSICGQPGSLRTDRHWWLTLCDDHAQVIK